MLFKDYLEQINKYAEEHPETLDLELLEYSPGYGEYDSMELGNGVLGHFYRKRSSFVTEEKFNRYNELYYMNEENKCKVDSICFR